ncbi:MAG: ATP-binding cassette domain-containing protein [Spirochaetales bacterium]|nr:ATP-binding cassette domain-containing protein [Spirochaetales bacterium]
MALIGVQDLFYAVGGVTLFDGISFQIDEGERLCILGRNGAGKSTLLKLLSGVVTPDRGVISRRQGLRLAMLDQEVPTDAKGSALEVALPQLTGTEDEWEIQHRAQVHLTKLGIDPDADFGTLSGGSRRRVLLAKALASSPELLLLDEPTNHLDIESIQYLEETLAQHRAAVVFVTHDRVFARKLARRVAEVDRGRFYAFTCGYDDFLSRREELLANEDQKWAEFQKKLTQEEAWLRRGVKARLSRNEGRVKALLKLRETWNQRRKRTGGAKFEIQTSERSGDLVCEVKKVSFGWGERTLLRDFSTSIMRGDRVGVIGPNGSGKTTLLNVLLGKLTPQSGSVRLGTALLPLYFDQLRSQLDPTKSVAENVGGGYDTIEFNGKPLHLLGYLEKFLFAPDRSRVPVSILSGGERNRLLLAKLFTRPSNLLVLDEPTNDLDSDTLDLLEDLLLEYDGTILLVSHDRDFLDNVVTSTLYLAGDGVVLENAGGWSDWAAHQARQKTEEPEVPVTRPPQQTPGAKARKLSFSERRELEGFPDRLAGLEKEQERLQNELADPLFYKSRASEVPVYKARLEEIEAETERLYQRWQDLEELAAQVESS